MPHDTQPSADDDTLPLLPPKAFAALHAGSPPEVPAAPPKEGLAPTLLIVLAERLCREVAGLLPPPLSPQQRQRLGHYVRTSAPLLGALTAAGVARAPQLFSAVRAPDGELVSAPGLRLRLERARAFLYLHHLLQQLADLASDAHLREQSAATAVTLAALRAAQREPLHPPGPRRSALREALTFWRLCCSFFKLPGPPATRAQHELLASEDRPGSSIPSAQPELRADHCSPSSSSPAHPAATLPKTEPLR